MDDSKALILVKSYLKDVHYKEPERAQNLNNRTVKAIKNAFDKAILDKRGWIWIEEESIHSLLRVKTKADARYYLQSVPKEYEISINGKQYIRGFVFISFINKFMEEKGNNKYLPIVNEYYNLINTSNDVKLVRLEFDNYLKAQKRKLKSKRIKKYNINTIFFSSTYKEKVLEIIKNNNCNNFNLINFDSENQFPIIEYEKLINIGRYIENYSIDNLSKEENREKSTIIVSLAGEKKYSQQEFIESANVIAKTARIRKRKEMNALEQVNTFYEVVIGIILPMICGLNTKYFADNELIKNDLLIIEENNKNMVILYRKHKYLVEHTGINTYVARAEENLPAREHKKDTQNFVLIKTDKKDRIKNNKSQVTV